MTILTVSELREHVETDLGDDAVQRLADAAEELIDLEDGGTGAVTEHFTAWNHQRGRDRMLFTARQISSISSITERDDPDDSETTLSANDYEQQGDRTLIRLRDGDNPRLLWAQHVKVTYTPASSTALRKRVQIDLVKLGVMYSGASRERIGDFDFTHFKGEEGVDAALAPLRNSQNRMPLR